MAAADAILVNDETTPSESKDFIRTVVENDNERGTYDGRVVTRFPPEPNGYLHIGHAKSISLNFGVAKEYGGVCHLRFDDTNPTTEDVEYVDSILEAIHWLGFDWGEHLYFASDYFEKLYQYAEQLIKDGKAYVDSSTGEEIRAYRGTVTEPGRNSPYRDRSLAENLDLFRRMRAGEFADGSHVLRAKIDMVAANMILRDPVLYRIRHAHHFRTGDGWCIYPLYDFAHPLSDAIEHITHSLCTLEFENNRAVYNWLVDNLGQPPQPRQYEFARMKLDYTVMSKRKLLQLVKEGQVSGWDDPRMPTLVAFRRRGVTPDAIRAFAERIGVAKVNSRIELELLEHIIRDDLNYRSPRIMAVLRPLKVVLTNYADDKVEWLQAAYWPRDIPKDETRKVPFARELFIERDDFSDVPPKGFRRLSPGQEVRLRYSYVIKCKDVIKDDEGNVVELHCTIDPDTLGANPKDRKVKGTIHWVSAQHSLPAEVRLYDRLFLKANPDDVEAGKTFKDYLNPNSLQTLSNARVEPSIVADPDDRRYQFERQGYFMRDRVDSRPERLVFNRIITLRDSWAKQSKPSQRSKESRAIREVEPNQETVIGTRSESRDRARADNPNLQAAYERYMADLDLGEQDADLLSGDQAIVAFFDDALSVDDNPRSVANWINNMLMGEIKDLPIDSLPFNGTAFGQLVALVDEGHISANIGKNVLSTMLSEGGDPDLIVEQKGLKQISDTNTLDPIIRQVISENPEKAAAYRSGKTGLLGFFMGQIMRTTGGKADPQLVREMLQDTLNDDL